MTPPMRPMSRHMPVDRSAPTDRIPAQHPAQPDAARPRTLPLPAVPAPRATGGRTRRRPPLAHLVQRTADLLDDHLDGRLDQAALVEALAAQVWPALPDPAATGVPITAATAGRALGAWHTALAAELDPVLARLRPEHAAYTAAATRPCQQCTPVELCVFDARQLKDWWDTLHATATDVTSALPARAARALPTHYRRSQ